MSTIARIPEEVYEEARKIAALRSTQPGAVIALAWTEYLDRHRDELAEEFESIGRALRDGDRATLAKIHDSNIDAEAESMAASIRTR